MSDDNFEEYTSELEDELLKSEDDSELDDYSELDSDEEPNSEDEDNFLNKINKYQDGIENYKTSLDKMLKQKNISKDDYYNELIQVEEFEIELNKQQNQIALTDTGLELIAKLESKREELKTNLGTLSLEDYNKQMLETIKEEKQIINDYQVITTREPKLDKLKVLPFLDKINELINREEKLVKKVAKETGIKLVKPKQSDPAYEAKLMEYNKNFSYILEYYLLGYKLSIMNPTNINPPTWELNYVPTVNSLKTLGKLEQPPKLIKDFELGKYGKPDLTKRNPIKDTTFIKTQFTNRVPVVNTTKITDLYNLNNLLSKISIKGKNIKELKVKLTETSITNFLESFEQRKLETIGRYKEPLSGKQISDIANIAVDNKVVSIQFKDSTKITVDTSLVDFFPLVKVDQAVSNTIYKDNITFIYILTRGSNKKIFINFKDYLAELKENLLNNLDKISDQDSVNVINFKIEQIDYYIENDKFMEPESILTKEDDSARQLGLKTLTDVMVGYQYSTDEKIKELETSIAVSSIEYAVFNKDTYNFLIGKVYFLSIQYQELIRDYLLARIPISTLINFEVPKYFPDDFTYKPDFKNLTPEQKLNKLLDWNPPNEHYDKYKSFVQEDDSIEAIDEKLINSNIFLDYKVIKAIYLEFKEKVAWDSYKRSVNLIRAPEFRNEYLWKFKILNQKRNTLPSMRIYQVATVSQRLEALKQIESSLVKCKINSPENVSAIIEKIVFERSKTDKDYSKTIQNAINNYNQFCSLVQTDNLKTESILTNIITLTEFFVNEGVVSKDKINKVIKLINEQNTAELESLLSPLESELINNVIIEVKDLRRKQEQDTLERNKLTIFSSFFDKLNRNKQQQERLNRFITDINKYSPPTVSDYKPAYGIKYIYSNGKYIYGGHYPGLKGPHGETNYTKDDLINLVELFGFSVNTENQIEDIYTDLMNQLDKLDTEKNVVLTDNISSLVDTTKDEQKLNTQIKSMFSFRKLEGYPEPGIPYRTYLDYDLISYCVPIKYKDGLPVYSLKQKDLATSKIAVIEGPCIFENSQLPTAVSEYYRLVEYLDHRGVKIYFKEGVYKDKIKYSINREINTCNFYKTKGDCLHPLSVSLNGSKCEWFNNKCIRTRSSIEQPDSRIWFWNTDEPTIKDLWNQKLQSIRNIILNILNGDNIVYPPARNRLLNKFTLELEDFKNSLEEKSRNMNLNNPDTKLDIHYMQVMTKKQLKEAKEKELIKPSLDLLDHSIIKDILKRRTEVKRESIPDGFVSLQIPIFSVEQTESKIYLPSRQGKRKQIDSKSVNTLKKTYINAYISVKDKTILDNPPESFFWFVRIPNYQYRDQSTEIEYTLEKVKNIPYQRIIPTGTVPEIGLPLITKKDIETTIINTAFSTFTDNDGLLEPYLLLDSEAGTVEFCLDNNINPIEINEGSSKLTLNMAIQHYSKNKVKTVSIEDKIKSSLERAIRQKNTDLLKSLIGQIKLLKDELDTDLLIIAQENLETILSEKEQTEKLAQKIEEKVREKKEALETKAKIEEKDTVKKFNKSINSTASKLSRKARKL